MLVDADAPAVRSPDLIDRLAKGVRAYLLLALIALVAGLQGFASVAPLDRDESRFVQATTQMLETGDFVRIFVQDEPRHKKPIGIHWLQAASVSATTGVEAREIWAYRLPSLLGAIITVLAAFWAGTALIGRRAAFVGASLLAASLLLSTEAMIAKTDAAMTAMTALALAAIVQLRAGGARRPKLLALLAWGALGAGILIKGPITPMVVGFCLIALGLWERRWDWMAPLAHWMGPALAGLICLPWLIAIGVETNGAFFAEAITGDLAPKVSAGGEHPFAPPGLHSLLAPLLLFPLAVGLAPGAVLGWKALRAPRISPDFKGERFLLAWALPSFLAFELATTKLAHYPLPTYPALALLCGLGLVRWWDDGRLMLRIAAALMFLVGSLGVIAACALLAGAMPGDEAASARRALQAGLIVGVVMAGAAIAIAASKRLSFALAISVFAALYGLWVLRERTLPEARTLLVSREANVALLRERLHPRLSPEAPGSLYVMGYNEASLVFETRSDVILTSGAKAGADAPVGAAVIAEGRERAAFEAALAGRGLAFEPAGPAVVGHNYSNDDAVTLQPGRVVDAAGR